MPEKDLNEILRLRREKLKIIREAGINPYPYRFEKSTHIPDLLKDFNSKMESEEGVGEEFAIAGRLTAIRVMGKAAFCHIRDEFGLMQVYVQRDRIGVEEYKIFKKLDISDFVGFRGTAFRTKTEEPSLRAASFELLSKSLRPLPVVKEVEGVKHHAFTDKEARYRQRYIDLAVNPEVRNIFRTRAKIISATREFLDGQGYLEVETPSLQPLYGGANARPFTTFYNVLERNFYLRIADELYLKRLIAGGFEKVYEICKDFRNEGMDKFHNPEFTMLEFYQAYADFEDIMNLAEDLFRHVAKSALGTTEVTYQGTTVDFGKPFRRARFFDLLKEYTGGDLLGMDLEQLGEFAKSQDIDITRDMGEGKILDELMKVKVRSNLVEPTFIYDYPLSLSPLAKIHREDNRLVERFQPFALGFELGNAFSELNDPLDQRARFEAQRKLKEAGDEETQPIDEDFLAALEYGMPPTGGMGIGVDRLVMLLTDQESIREVILFPQSSSLKEPFFFTLRKQISKIIDSLDSSVIGGGLGTQEGDTNKATGRKLVYETSSIIIKNWIRGLRAAKVVFVIMHDLNVGSDDLVYIRRQIKRNENLSRVVNVIFILPNFSLDGAEDFLEQLNLAHVQMLTVSGLGNWIDSFSKGTGWLRNRNKRTIHRFWCPRVSRTKDAKTVEFLMEGDKLGTCCRGDDNEIDNVPM